jgi:DNA-binding cell septation regulator SpoVG
MISVDSIRAIENAGNLKALAVITVAGKLKIADVKVVQQQGQAAWVAMPSKSYEVEGKRRWSSTVEILDQELKNEIATAVLEEYDKFQVRSSNGAKQEPSGW